MKTIIMLILMAIISNNSFASAKYAQELYLKDISPQKNKKIAHELIQGQFYFSAIPYINMYLEEHNEMDSTLEADIDMLIIKTGTMAVLNLDENRLKNFNIPSIFLILGTRQFNKEEYDAAYETLSKIPNDHKFSVEADLIKGTIKDIKKRNDEALLLYKSCIQKSEKQESVFSSDKLKRYYTYLKETCIARGGRIKIEEKKFDESLEYFNMIDKRSYKWPYILMDKAWAYYYLKDYNRVLGITVSYKSPLLESYFFPESEVLMGLAYYNMCLYDDAMKVVDHFYEVYRPKADALKEIIGQNKRSDTYFLELYYADSKTREELNPFIRNLITQTRKQVKFNLDLGSYKAAKEELLLIKRLKNKTEFTASMQENVEATIKFIGVKINYYIKKEIFSFINEIHKHSYSMFNLKLELLSKIRQEIYSSKGGSNEDKRDRGSDSNIHRKTSQYFFDFNGSFWADELGDYSFGLKNACETTEANK